MDYFWDGQLNLFRSADVSDFGYSDGVEVESGLLEIVSAAKDRSTFSAELSQSITDWPTEYHLSRSRHCLVRPLGIQAGSKVLELGCGCGAITRFLGEAGADVAAVEGSLLRARVAAERCRGLGNVRVFAEDLLKFEIDERFDFVLLIGVLEYAAVFSDQEDPFGHYLRAVARFLAPEGNLAVAIENKLGLKYFNGCGEDHVGISYFGIQNLYGPKTVRTFGRQELVAQLSAAGFPHTYFYYPFPDYKLPTVILSEESLNDPVFDPVDLLARAHARDYLGLPYRSFDEALAFSALGENGLIKDLSNSFLVVATAKPVVSPTTPELASAYSTNRAPEFCTQTRFLRHGTGIIVSKEPITSIPAHPVDLPNGATVTQHFAEAAYKPGRQLFWELLKARARSGDLQDTLQALRPWVEYLLQHAKRINAELRGPATLASYQLPGKYIDCTPFNLLDTGAELVAIDLEWESDRDIPLGWVVTRGILWSINFGLLLAGRPHTIAKVVEMLAASCGLAVTGSEIQVWLDQEGAFLASVLGRPSEVLPTNRTAAGIVTFGHAVASLREQKAAVDEVLSGREAELAKRAEQIATRDKWIAGLDQMLDEHSEKLRNATSEIDRLSDVVGDLTLQGDLLRAALARRDEHLKRIQSSTPWRLTYPLRAVEKLKPSHQRRARQLERDRQLLAQSRFFDAKWYISHYPDVEVSGADPIVHYIQHGAIEGRDPSEHFSTKWYLQRNSDVVASGINPLVHYLRCGLQEGREPRPPRTEIASQESVAADHEVFDYMATAFDPSELPVSVAIGVSSLGNFFMAEIARMLEDAFRQLGVSTRLFTECDYVISSSHETVIIVAPHEFFCLGNGPAAFRHIRRHARLVMLNTEQSQTQWFCEAAKYLPAAAAIVDINHDSAEHLLHKGYNSFFLPLGYSDYINRTFDGSVLPDHELFSYLPRSVRERAPASYSERPIDILFVGTSSPRRQQFFASNAAFFAGRSSFIYIPDGDVPFLPGTSRTLDFAALVALARRSKILLNIHRDETPYLEWQRIVTLGIMQKTVVITDLCEAGPCIEPGVDYLEAPLQQVPELCDHILSNISEGAGIAARAYNKLKVNYPMEEIVGRCWAAIAQWTDVK